MEILRNMLSMSIYHCDGSYMLDKFISIYQKPAIMISARLLSQPFVPHDGLPELFVT